MISGENSEAFLRWHQALRQLAQVADSAWLVSTEAKSHFAAYQKGLSPEEELAELDELAQWRGCGCGGS
ncbi:MAG: hypothetical protein AB9Q22_11945 [Candidatus Reddybacter sp.]